MTKIDLTSMTTEALTQLAADVRGEMSRRAGKPLLAWRGSNCDAGESYHIPAGGALLCDRPAIGGDRSSDYWYPSLDAANAALRLSAGDSTVVVREDGKDADGKPKDDLPLPAGKFRCEVFLDGSKTAEKTSSFLVKPSNCPGVQIQQASSCAGFFVM